MKKTRLLQLMKTSRLALALLLSMPLSAKTVYVKPDAANVWAGQENVYTSFNEAYAAAEANDNIWVAAGEYPVSATMTPKNVKIYGGFKGTETSIDERVKATDGKAWEFVNTSILKLNANMANGIFGVVNNGSVTPSTIFWIDGITLDGDKSNNRTGRAIHIQGTGSGSNDIRITNCIIQNFKSNADGGGLNLRSTGVTVAYCLIQNNEGNKGGAGYFDRTTIHHCEIINNSVPTTLTSYQGSTSGGGGGILLANSEFTVAYDCYIANNTASFGGGAFVRNNASVYNCIIVDNISEISGSGICFEGRDNGGAVYNCIIANNQSKSENSAGVCFTSTASGVKTQTLRNSVLYNNMDSKNNIISIGAVATTGSISPVITNNILDKTYTDFLAGTANLIETDPVNLFTEIASDDHTPPTGFLGIDMGDAAGLTFAGNLDYAGAARIQETSIDIGPYEFIPNTQSVIVTNSNFVTITSDPVTEVETGQDLIITFILDTGCHSPYVSVNNTKTDVTEDSGTYTLSISNVAETQTINITAFEANILPVSEDTYQRRSGNISGDYANEPTLGSRGETAGYALTPLLKFVPTEAMKTAGYNSAKLKLVMQNSKTSQLTYTAHQFLNSAYSNINEVPAADYNNVRNAPAVGAPTSNVVFVAGESLILDVSDEYTFEALDNGDIKFAIVKSSNGNIDHFYSLENGNSDYIPVLVFEKLNTNCPVTITNNEGSGMTVTSGGNTVAYGEDYTLTFTVESGYHAPAVLINGTRIEQIPMSSDGVYTLTIPKVREELIITLIACWPTNEIPVTYDATAMGSATASTIQIGRPGNSGRFGLWKFDMTDAPAAESYNKITLNLTAESFDADFPEEGLGWTLSWRSNYLCVINNGSRVENEESANLWTESNLNWNGISATGTRPATKEGFSSIIQTTTTAMTTITYDITGDNLELLKGFIADATDENKALSFMIANTDAGTLESGYIHSHEGALNTGNKTLCPVLIFSNKSGDGTILPDNTINDPVISTRYYTLQGIEIAQPTPGNMYVVKTCHKSGKSEAKITYINK